MLMIRVNVPSQISSDIFVNGEAIQMHTIRESNYAVIKQPRNGNRKEKKVNENNSICKSYQAQPMEWMHLMVFTQIIHA